MGYWTVHLFIWKYWFYCGFNVILGFFISLSGFTLKQALKYVWSFTQRITVELLEAVCMGKDACEIRIQITSTNKHCVYNSALLFSIAGGFLTEISTAGRTSVVR